MKQETGMEGAVRLAGSQSLLADAVGVTQQHINKCVQQGHASLPTAQTIASLYGIELSRLVSPRLRELLEAGE